MGIQQEGGDRTLRGNVTTPRMMILHRAGRVLLARAMTLNMIEGMILKEQDIADGAGMMMTGPLDGEIDVLLGLTMTILLPDVLLLRTIDCDLRRVARGTATVMIDTRTGLSGEQEVTQELETGTEIAEGGLRIRVIREMSGQNKPALCS